MANDSEASVEEILDSIKKVMERDSRASVARARQRKVEEADEAEAVAQTSASTDEAEDEILDLADLELTEIVEDDHEDESTDGPLIADEVRGAMQENLAALAMLAEPPAKPQIVRSGETSLEGLTRELLRPMLAEWLDKNLPGMVEKLVQAEIARIAGKRK
ncbi:MAG: DUF2497 domain-containing protein [Pseudomonadota bacterium]